MSLLRIFKTRVLDAHDLEERAHEAYGSERFKDAEKFYRRAANRFQVLLEEAEDLYDRARHAEDAMRCWYAAAGACDRVGDLFSRHPSRQQAAQRRRELLEARGRN